GLRASPPELAFQRRHEHAPCVIAAERDVQQTAADERRPARKAPGCHSRNFNAFPRFSAPKVPILPLSSRQCDDILVQIVSKESDKKTPSKALLQHEFDDRI